MSKMIEWTVRGDWVFLCNGFHGPVSFWERRNLLRNFFEHSDYWRPFIFSLVRKRIILLKVPTTLIQILYFCCLCLKCWHIVNIFLLRQAGLGPRWNLKLIMIYSKVQNDKFLNRFRHFFYLCDVYNYIYYLAQD